MDLGETTPTCYGLVLFQDGQRIIELEVRLEGTIYLNTDSGLWNTKNSKTDAMLQKLQSIRQDLYQDKLTLKFKGCTQLYWKCSRIRNVSLKKVYAIKKVYTIRNAKEILFRKKNV